MNENDTPGRKKMFEVRESDRDVSFLRRFLTEDIMRQLDLFQHEKRGKDRVVTKVSDEESWQSVKQTLLQSVGMGSIPQITVQDADHGGRRSIYLKHEHEGRDLQLEYAERTIEHVRTLWGKDVLLETVLNGRKSVLKMVNDSLKIERL